MLLYTDFHRFARSWGRGGSRSQSRRRVSFRGKDKKITEQKGAEESRRGDLRVVTVLQQETTTNEGTFFCFSKMVSFCFWFPYLRKTDNPNKQVFITCFCKMRNINRK